MTTTTNMAQVDPLWGRPFEQYIHSFKIEATKKRINWRHDFELEKARHDAASVIHKIYEIAAELKVVESDCSEGFITLPMLKLIDKLSYSPITLADLGHTALVSGCITLMKVASQSIGSSVFGYEYGYLCLRIIAIATGVCMLARCNQYSKAFEEMLSDTKTDPVVIMSQNVSRLIQDEVLGPGNKRYHDVFDMHLGWARSKNHPTQDPFARRSEFWTLVELLYANRKQLLIVLGSTYHLGLSGLMYLLWRYHWFDSQCRKNGLEDAHASEEFMPLFGEILWRYLLIAPTNQSTPLMMIYEQMGELAKLGHPKAIDLEDSKFVICTYIMRLAPTDTHFYAPLPLLTISVLLLHTASFLLPGCEDLVPQIFGATIQRLWKALLDNKAKTQELVEAMRDEFQILCHHLNFLEIGTNQAAIARVLDEIAENDYVELTLRILLKLNMEVGDNSVEPELIGEYLDCSAGFFSILGRAAPKELVQDTFHYLAPGLARFATFLWWRRTLTGLTDKETTLIYRSGICFGKIRGGIKQENNVKEFERPPVTPGVLTQAALDTPAESVRVLYIVMLNAKQQIGAARIREARTKRYAPET